MWFLTYVIFCIVFFFIWNLFTKKGYFVTYIAIIIDILIILMMIQDFKQLLVLFPLCIGAIFVNMLAYSEITSEDKKNRL
jgi:hypothetical protein